ncbi:MAG: hypothetical protein R6W96_08660 [Clostridia bacterium]
MSDEKRRILKMLEDKSITSDEALDLLNALRDEEEEIRPTKKPGKKATMLRVRIEANEKNDTVAKVNVNLPLSVAKKITQLQGLVPKEAKDKMSEKGISFDGINLKELIEAFESGDIDENLVDIVASDEDSKAVVRIYVD